MTQNITFIIEVVANYAVIYLRRTNSNMVVKSGK